MIKLFFAITGVIVWCALTMFWWLCIMAIAQGYYPHF